MTEIDRQVRTVQRRLWANLWLEQASWALTGAAGAFAAVVVAARLFGRDWPLGVAAGVLAVLAVLLASLRSYLLRASRDVAAATLDEAAGLRERVSTGLYCRTDLRQQDDEFARAVVTDAERISRSLSARQHVRLRAPFPLVYAGASTVVAALLLLLPAGLLAGEQERQAARDSRELARTRVVVQKRLEEIKKVAQTNPAMKDLKDALEKLSLEPQGRLEKPEQVRNEAIKRIDKLGDLLREQRRGEKHDRSLALKKMLRRIRQPGEAKSSADKLAQALARGDFKSGQEQLQAMKEQLARLKSPEDAEQLQAMQKQLEELARKISRAADDKRLAERLEQAGVEKKDIERMLRKLTKKDLDQLKQQLQKQGLTQKQIEKLARQLQQRQQACEACQQLAQAMQQAANAASEGNAGQTMAGLENAADQLSEMEMLEQELQQIDSMLASLQDAKNGLDNPCNNCGGAGCEKCRPGGMGRDPRQGRGGLAPEEATRTDFRRHRAKVKTTEGRIIGQFLVDGQQAKGEVGSELGETVRAAEREATDLVRGDRIPRQYQKSVKEYFSAIRRQIDRAGPRQPPAEEASDPETGEPSGSSGAEKDTAAEEDSR